MVSVEEGQLPFEFVQTKMEGGDIPIPVTVVEGSNGSFKTPEPETTVHIPVPIAGGDAPRTTVVPWQAVWSGPAWETEGIS